LSSILPAVKKKETPPVFRGGSEPLPEQGRTGERPAGLYPGGLKSDSFCFLSLFWQLFSLSFVSRTFFNLIAQFTSFFLFFEKKGGTTKGVSESLTGKLAFGMVKLYGSKLCFF
jgi:hypothetical protein